MPKTFLNVTDRILLSRLLLMAMDLVGTDAEEPLRQKLTREAACAPHSGDGIRVGDFDKHEAETLRRMDEDRGDPNRF